eukprot:126729-Rhodomonas_salina.3
MYPGTEYAVHSVVQIVANKLVAASYHRHSSYPLTRTAPQSDFKRGIMTTMRRVFEDYCAGNKAGMDGKHFAKLARDTSLLDSKLTTTEVDLTFSKIKDRSQRRITFDQFQDGLSILAKKKGVKINDITAILEKSNGRILYGTVAEPNKFHDDKSLYTGVYANGGPSNVDTDKISDISQLMDRSPADARGVKKDGIGAYNDWGGGFKKKQLELGLKRGESRSTTAASAPCEDKSELRQVFKYYCEAGKKVMDSARLAKLTRDCKLLDQELTATDVDLFFVKVKAREEKRISYEQFLIILSMFAAKKGVETREIEATVSKSQGPILYGTIAEPNKYHDDKNYYTGVHAFGGPSIIEDHKVCLASSLCSVLHTSSSSSSSSPPSSSSPLIIFLLLLILLILLIPPHHHARSPSSPTKHHTPILADFRPLAAHGPHARRRPRRQGEDQGGLRVEHDSRCRQLGRWAARAQKRRSATGLRSRYAMSDTSTDVPYGASLLRPRYAKSGTDLVYGATRAEDDVDAAAECSGTLLPPVAPAELNEIARKRTRWCARAGTDGGYVHEHRAVRWRRTTPNCSGSTATTAR